MIDLTDKVRWHKLSSFRISVTIKMLIRVCVRAFCFQMSCVRVSKCKLYSPLVKLTIKCSPVEVSCTFVELDVGFAPNCIEEVRL